MRNTMRNTMVILAFFVLSAFISIGFAKDAGKAVKPQDKPASQEPKKEVTYKEITGKVSGLSSNFIAVVYGFDAKNEASLEAAFKLNKDLRIVHKESLKDIQMGDTVKVGFEETLETFADARASRSVKVKTITFLQRAPKELVSDESAQIKDAAPAQEKEASQGENALPLKGLKGGK